MISTNNRQIKLYYNSETSLGQQTLAYVDSSEKKVLAIDISKTSLTGTQWIEITDNLKVHISELVNQQHPDFIKIYGDKEVNLEQHDWLKLIENNPVIVNKPIVINGKQFIRIDTPSDFVKFLDKE